MAHTFVCVWEEVTGLLAEMDVLLGFADLAASAPTPYVRPAMLPADAGEVVLEGGGLLPDESGASSLAAVSGFWWVSGFGACRRLGAGPGSWCRFLGKIIWVFWVKQRGLPVPFSALPPSIHARPLCLTTACCCCPSAMPLEAPAGPPCWRVRAQTSTTGHHTPQQGNRVQ